MLTVKFGSAEAEAVARVLAETEAKLTGLVRLVTGETKAKVAEELAAIRSARTALAAA